MPRTPQPTHRKPTPRRRISSQFRIAGFGGAAVFMRPTFVAGVTVGSDGPVPAMDIGLASPDSIRYFLQRPFSASFPEALGDFLFAAAEHFHPEVTLPAVQDSLAGIVVTVDSSADDRVCLDWCIVEDPHSDVPEFERLNFETSRAALVSASRATRSLWRQGPSRQNGDGY